MGSPSRRLLDLALFTALLAAVACAPTRTGDDDDDDDDTAPPTVEPTEGRWTMVSSEIVSDDCQTTTEVGAVQFTLDDNGDGELVLDFFVDTLVTCDLYGSDLSCSRTEFSVQTDEITRISGEIDLDGEFSGPEDLEGQLIWQITCSGDCEEYELPNDVTCNFVIDGVFEYDPEQEPTPIG